VFDKEGYPTLNFIPSLATMIFGLMTGELLRGPLTGKAKFWRIIGWGIAALAVGTLIEVAGICPIVKRIWTPSFAIYSTGWVLLMLAAFYGLVELLGWRRWTWPLVVVGMNSIAIYCLAELLRPWLERTLETHFGPHVFELFGENYTPIAQSLLVLAVIWLIAVWMYRQRIFVRI
jgi:heparan-alpha-glucosaminide N-acetyltransferase